MRLKTKIMAALAAATVGLTAAPAVAQDAPSTPPSNGGVTFGSDGELTPLCIFTLRISLFGTTLIDEDNICLG